MNIGETELYTRRPGNTKIVVPSEIRSAYLSSSDDRKSITIIEIISATGNAIPPYLITWGKRKVHYPFEDGLEKPTVFNFSYSGYINDEIGIKYMEQFIKHATKDEKYPAQRKY